MRHRAVPGPATEHVLGRDIPQERGPGEEPDPYAASGDDHPCSREQNYKGWGDLRFSLRLLPIAQLVDESRCPGGVHGSHCYTAEQFDADAIHDIADPDYDEDDNLVWEDSQYVRQLAEHAEQLPPLIIAPAADGGRFFGGGHRLAAWRDAGLDPVPCWVPDESQ